jgi:hypothetical protein
MSIGWFARAGLGWTASKQALMRLPNDKIDSTITNYNGDHFM